eukprot:GHRR01014605.1.p1 GENE.GHRR01014605.1~~GHRR01014605.1.p1  ORF type:complete len:707 (+),score=303.14 GHRR01014605.1:547-2667(+)
MGICQAMVERLSRCGVAPISWVDIEGSIIAVGSGPVEAASNTETSCMQAVQAAIIAAAAEAAAQQKQDIVSTAPEATAALTSNGSNHRQQQQQHRKVFLLDRTERLANSLGRMVGVVEAINNLNHKFGILLMAGRRSTDLMHLLLQNLYFMKHARNYVGTSSLLAVALLNECLIKHSWDLQQRQSLMGKLMGTHAHEMTSMTQQLLVGYDQEAGRRCGLQAPVCLSQLLGHLLFMVANGDMTPTALPDTFTTPYFVQLAAITALPPEFIEDMHKRWGTRLAAGSRCFDLFRLWRIDSGDYAALAQLLIDTWKMGPQANAEHTAAAAAASEHAESVALEAAEKKTTAAIAAGGGEQGVPPPVFMYSNIDSVNDIQKLIDLPEHIRPRVLGFGGLADGFLPFDPYDASEFASSVITGNSSKTAAATANRGQQSVDNGSGSKAAAVGAPDGDSRAAALAPAGASATGESSQAAVAAKDNSAASISGPTSNITGISACAGANTDAGSNDKQHLVLPMCSLVMKAVQARLKAPHSSHSSSSKVHSSSPPAAAAAACGPGSCSYDYAATVPDAAAAPTQATANRHGDPPGSGSALQGSSQQQSQLRDQCSTGLQYTSSQESAVKLGDAGLSKAQVDPRLSKDARDEVLARIQQMAAAREQLSREKHGDVLDKVLREMYVAVSRNGGLNASLKPAASLEAAAAAAVDQVMGVC